MNGESHTPAKTMSPDEFREAGYRHIDWIANYFEHVRDFPVLPNAEPGDLTARQPLSAPESGEPIERILEDFTGSVFPGLTLWNHPRFFAWFANSSSPPSILAELLTAAMNVNVMLWKSSPSATELEQVTLGWLRQWLQLSESFFGVIYDTASVGVLQAIGAAREWKDPECRVKGMKSGMTVYISEHTHSSSEKAAITLGFGQENVRKIGVDDRFRMRPDLLEEAISADLDDEKTPCCVVATVGTTSIASIDPVPAIATIAERYGLWLHVDAAYGGPAAMVPEMRHILDGAERAHSLILNPHKCLFVSMDCSVLYTRFPEVLKRASSLRAEYLMTAEDSLVVNYNDYGVQLGRRFRALKLWYVMRYYGRQGVIALLRDTLRLAQQLAAWIQDDCDFELCAPVLFSLVCFRHKGSDAVNRRTLETVNKTGYAFLSHTVLNGEFVLRFAIGNMQTNGDDIQGTWDLIARTAAEEAAAEKAMAAQT